MGSSIIKAIQDSREQYVKMLSTFTDEELEKHIKDELRKTVEYKIPIEQLLARWLAEDAGSADEFIEMTPAMETHNAIAKYLADGGMVSPKVVQWFAERVYNPELLHQKKGPKGKPMYHRQVRYFMNILVNDLGKRVKDANAIMVEASNRSDWHIRDIYTKKKK